MSDRFDFGFAENLRRSPNTSGNRLGQTGWGLCTAVNTIMVLNGIVVRQEAQGAVVPVVGQEAEGAIERSNGLPYRLSCLCFHV